MKKTLAIVMLSILALMLISGCQSNKATSPATQTQVKTTSNTADAQNTAAITEADTTTKALDTTQVDKDLASAGTSLNNW